MDVASTEVHLAAADVYAASIAIPANHDKPVLLVATEKLVIIDVAAVKDRCSRENIHAASIASACRDHDIVVDVAVVKAYHCA